MTKDEKKYLYVLTDGNEIFASKVMTYDQWCMARRAAANATRGNINWSKVSEMPVHT